MRCLRNISVLFCMLLVASPVLTHLFFQAQTAVVKQQMKRNLEKGQLVTIRLRSSEIHWYKKDKELQIGTELFDVKTITPTKDGYVVTGLFDKEEKELKKSIEGLAKKEQKQKTEKLLSFLQLMCPSPNEIILVNQPAIISKNYPHYSENTVGNFQPVIIPPPKVFLVI